MEELIYSYTAEQAIEDGILTDVGGMAREAGFRWPVRITAGVVDLCTPPKRNKLQSFEGRLWDVLNMARFAISRAKDEGMVQFFVKIGPRKEKLWACMDTTSGPGVHILKPEEY